MGEGVGECREMSSAVAIGGVPVTHFSHRQMHTCVTNGRTYTKEDEHTQICIRIQVYKASTRGKKRLSVLDH